MNYIYKSKVHNHSKIKKQLLDKINLIPTNPLHSNNESIMHTDWNLPPNMHREYASLFFEVIKPHMAKITQDLKCSRYDIELFWFQRYGHKSKHSWHTHPRAHFANVYFVECPKGLSTKFMHFEEECEEGDIISFPAFLPHSSPMITENSYKTIISFNSSIHYEPM